MQQAIEQLRHIRRRARAMLVMLRICQWVGVMLAVALILAFLDFGLRLPEWLRLMVGLGVVISAAWWLATRLRTALEFDPDLSLLALRAEKLYPELRGEFASAVEFVSHPSADDQAQTRQLAAAAVARVQTHIDDKNFSRLLDSPRLRHAALAAGGVLLLVLLATVLWTSESALAARRWLLPLGDAAWPRRVNVDSLVTHRVWPNDTPLTLAASVDKGYSPGMRTVVSYRILQDGQVVQVSADVIMNEQAQEAATSSRAGRFEHLVDIPALLSGAEARGQSEPVVEFSFRAGDDHTEVQQVALVARPALEAMVARITPPDYAREAVSPTTARLHDQAGQVAALASLAGSRIDLTLTFNKPIPLSPETWKGVLPGLAKLPGTTLVAPLEAAPARELSFSLVLSQSAQSGIRLVDAHGLESASDRQYRFDAIADTPAVVSIVEPVGDESVLATAQVKIEAAARDDVALRQLLLQSEAPQRSADGSASDENKVTRQLAVVEQTQTELHLTHTLDLAPLALQAGDVVTLTAVARDIFELDGQVHDPVISTPRHLRIIDAAALIAQVRAELTGLRQQALRLAARQTEIMQEPASQSVQRQQQLARNISTQVTLVKRLRARLDRNRLADEQLAALLTDVGSLLEQAGSEAGEAARKMRDIEDERDQHKQEAETAEVRAGQQSVVASLTDLANLLDQGKDALTLHLQLRQLEAMQQALAQDTRTLLPRTLGQDPQALDPALRAQLEALQTRQRDLAAQADALVAQMQSTADAMKQDPHADEAAAAALKDAAAMAQRQGLSQDMQQAAAQMQENQLSTAGGSQEKASATMQQMLAQMQDQQQRRQAVLRRKIMQLAEFVERLVRQQQAQLERLDAADALPALAPPMNVLRGNTLSAEAQAKGEPATAVAAAPLNKAVGHQGDAIGALGAAHREQAGEAEKASLAALEEALASLRGAADQAEAQQRREALEDLRKRYLELAEDQRALHASSARLAQAEALTRQQRGELVQLGHKQADVRIAARDELLPRVRQRQVFAYFHDQIEELAAGVTARLRSGNIDSGSLADQQAIASMLDGMAAALEPGESDEVFARPEQGGDGGGGGGQGGGQGGAVPPLADLKLLRGRAETILERMRMLEAEGDQGDALLRQDLLRLGTQQRELAALTQRLLDQSQQQHPGAGAVGPPEQPVGPPDAADAPDPVTPDTPDAADAPDPVTPDTPDAAQEEKP